MVLQETLVSIAVVYIGATTSTGVHKTTTTRCLVHKLQHKFALHKRAVLVVENLQRIATLDPREKTSTLTREMHSPKEVIA
jgi:hypothetical protein